jgi:hypothetical protein
MKQLKPKRQEHLERRRKKAAARRKRKAAEKLANNPPEAPKKLSAPRSMLRKQELLGTTYWRGDRFCLEGYKGR